MRGATSTSTIVSPSSEFQSTRPMRGATFKASSFPSITAVFQSTRPMRGATFTNLIKKRGTRDFNPHAPCGARPATKGYKVPIFKISIHTPHAGRDDRAEVILIFQTTFQSTRPMRGATADAEANEARNDISIHTPHAGRDNLQFYFML